MSFHLQRQFRFQEYQQGLQIDELSWKSDMTVNQTVSLLLGLEFSGVVTALPGKTFKLST